MLQNIDNGEHKVLVVDDNPATCYATSRVLRAAGFRTIEANTGTDAIRLLDDNVSAAVLDVHLPDIDGFEVCRITRDRPDLARLPIIHLSAVHVQGIDKVKALDIGADAYLTHPAEPAVLVATVEALIRARTAEMAMRRSEAKFRAIYDQAISGICLLDEEGRFVDANPAMLNLLDYPAERLIGRPVQSFVPQEWAGRVAEITAAARNVVWRGELPLVNAQGKLVYLEWSVSSRLEQGVRVATVSNVSERIGLEERRERLLEQEQAARASAERLARMKDEFIAVLSHELRTPLNAIMGWTHVLQKRDSTPETQRGLAAIERNARLQTRIISDILDVSRINMGKLQLDREMVDPAELTATAVAAMQADLAERELQVELNIEGGRVPIWLDPARFQQVLWNLLSNAAKFSARGGVIRVGLEAHKSVLTLTVQDEGQGIKPEFLPYLFDRFTQSQSARNRYQGGLGLGLSIVQHIVELHGGTVQAISKGPGTGALFEVRIPFAAPQAQTSGASREEHAEAGAPAAQLDGLDLLVIDDDADACAMLRIILGEQGAHVRVAMSVGEAWQLINSRRPDIVVCDIGLPGQDGYDFVRELRQQENSRQLPRLPVVAFTAFARDQDRDLALTAGFDAHCAKPLKPQELFSVIKNFHAAPSRGVAPR